MPLTRSSGSKGHQRAAPVGGEHGAEGRSRRARHLISSVAGSICASSSARRDAPTQRDRFEPACQDKPTSPIYAPAFARTAPGAREQRRGQARLSPAAPLLRAGNGYFWGLVDGSCCVSATLNAKGGPTEEGGHTAGTARPPAVG